MHIALSIWLIPAVIMLALLWGSVAYDRVMAYKKKLPARDIRTLLTWTSIGALFWPVVLLFFFAVIYPISLMLAKADEEDRYRNEIALG